MQEHVLRLSLVTAAPTAEAARAEENQHWQ